MPCRIFGALLLLLLVSVSVSIPLSARAQVFNDVISQVFAVGSGDPDPATSSCVEEFGMNPTGSLLGRCTTTGGNLAGGSNSTTSGAITNVTAAAPARAEKVVGPLNMYISADYEHFDKDVTTFEPGYKNYIWRGAVGADFSVEKATLGGALRYQHDNGKFDHQNGMPKFETNSYGLVLYANLTPTPVSFLAISAGYLRQDMSIDRAVYFDPTDSGGDVRFFGIAHGDPDGNEIQAELATGYDFQFGSVSVGPRVRGSYVNQWIDDYSEDGNTGMELRYSDLYQESLTSSVGLFASMAISTSFGVIVPQIGADYVHEFMDPQKTTEFHFVGDLNRIPFKFENDDPDRNYCNVAGGVVFQLANGIAPFVSYRAMLGYKDQSSQRVTAGARFEF